MGRPKGSKNKVSGAAKAVIAAFIEKRAPKVVELWDCVAKKDPARAMELYAKLAEFVVPKLARSEVTGEDGGPLVVEFPPIPQAPRT